LTADQESIRDTARAFLRESCDFASLRRVIDGDAGWDADLWKRFAGELGLPAWPFRSAWRQWPRARSS
jgi:hypothetical protein